MVVDCDAEGRQPTRHIFVAIAKGPKGLWSRYLAECVIYELSDAGRPCGLCRIPRMVSPRQFRSLPAGLAWCTLGGGVARIAARSGLGSWRAPGSDDELCEIDWYREFRPVARQAWLTADPLDRVAAFSARHLFRCTSGGYVRAADEPIYRFPLSEVDLSDGTSRELDLVVPLEHQVPLPETNVEATTAGRHALGPYLLAITRLDIDEAERTLKIVLATEQSATTLEFALGGRAE